MSNKRLAIFSSSRGCPLYILSHIKSPMFRRVKSRTVINGMVSAWELVSITMSNLRQRSEALALQSSSSVMGANAKWRDHDSENERLYYGVSIEEDDYESHVGSIVLSHL